jgi:hypothetical protein
MTFAAVDDVDITARNVRLLPITVPPPPQTSPPTMAAQLVKLTYYRRLSRLTQA